MASEEDMMAPEEAAPAASCEVEGAALGALALGSGALAVFVRPRRIPGAVAFAGGALAGALVGRLALGLGDVCFEETI